MALNQEEAQHPFGTAYSRLMEQIQKVAPYDAGGLLILESQSPDVIIFRRWYYLNSPTSDKETVFEVNLSPELSEMVKLGKPMIIPTDLNSEDWLAPMRNSSARSWLIYPILAQGAMIALLSLEKNEANFYTFQHKLKISELAGQISLAVENTLLGQETAENLAREQSLNKVSQAISSSLDLSTVLQTVVQLAAELVHADASELELLSRDGDTLVSSFTYRLPENWSTVPLKRGTGISWSILETGQSILQNDYSLHPQAMEGVESADLRSYIGVPIISGATPLGVLCLFGRTNGAQFTERDLLLSEMIGRQAGIAIQNARLYESLQHRAKEAETLRQAAAAVISETELDQVLNRILVQLIKVVHFDWARILLLKGDVLEVVASQGLPHNTKTIGQTIPASAPLFQECLTMGKPIIIGDPQKYPILYRPDDSSPSRSWIGVPMQLRGRAIGLLTISSDKVNEYTEAEATLTQAFANEVTIAVENARLFSELQSMATTDSLTNLLNRRHFISLAKTEFQRARRYRQPLSIILLDIDHFKRINDVYGHPVGDQVLSGFARIFEENLRQVDLVGRYGGEEFIALLPNTNLQNAQIVANRVLAQITNTPILTDAGPIQITASLGVAEMDNKCPDIFTLLKFADRAAYAAKQSGKNRVSISEEEQLQ